MRTFALALAAGTALAVAAPAMAQVGVNAAGSAGISNRIYQLETRLQAGISAGTITRAEAREIRPQLRQLRRLEAQYAVNGFTQQERQDLQARIREVRQDIRLADGGRSRYRDWADADDDPYYEQSAYHQVSQVCAARSGLGGVLGAVFGNDNCLRVGERVPYGLSAMPSQFRNQFPDGNGYYHRYLDGNVVQIDSRTGLVARIFQVH